MATNENILIRLMADTSNYTAKMQAASASAEKLSTSLERPRSTSERLEAGFTKTGLAVGALSAAIGVAAVKSFMDFDAKMSEVQANTGTTGSSLNALRDAALNASRTSIYSAEDAADAINELAKAGMSTSDILNGGLSAALTLAASDNMSTADATRYLTSAMTEFGLSGKDATSVADALAAGAGKALGSVSDMGNALSMVGGTAHMMGASMQETVGTLAAMANAGNIGSDAGTELRSALIGLMSPSKQVSDEMKTLGLNLYDGQGKFVGIANFAGQLHDRLSALPEAERNNAMGILFSNAAMSAGNVLYRQGADGIGKWTKEVSQSGYAAQIAAEKTDNLKGDLTKFAHTAQDTLIGIGSAANGPLRTVTEDATNLLNLFRSMPASAQQWTVGAGLIVGAAAGLHTVFGKLSTSTSSFQQSMGLVLDPVQRVQAGFGGLKSMVGSIAAGFGSAERQFQTFGTTVSRTQAVSAGAKAGLGGLVGMLGGPWGIALTAAGMAVDIFAQKQADAKTRTDNLSKALQSGQSAAQKFKQDISSGTDTDWGWFQKMTTGVGGLSDALKKAGVNSDIFVSAATGDKAAMAAFNAEIEPLNHGLNAQPALYSELKSKMDQFSKANNDAKAATKAQADAEAQATEEKVNGTLATAGLTDATSQSTTATQQSADANDILSVKMGASTKGIDDQASALGEAIDAMKSYYGFAVSASDADIQLHEAFDTASQSISQNGRTLDINTQQGRSNQKALNDIATSALDAGEAHARAGDDVSKIRPIIMDARDRFVNFAQSMGLSKEQAQNLADQSGLTSSAVDMFSGHVQGAGNSSSTAAGKVQGLGTDIRNLPGGRNIPVNVTGNAGEVLYRIKDEFRTLPDGKTISVVMEYTEKGQHNVLNGVGGTIPKYAVGGYVSGPGNGTSDSITARVSNGEYIVPADVVKSVGVGFLDALNYRRYADGGLVSRYAAAPVPVAVNGIPSKTMQPQNTFYMTFTGLPADHADVYADAAASRFRRVLGGRITL